MYIFFPILHFIQEQFLLQLSKLANSDKGLEYWILKLGCSKEQLLLAIYSYE